VNVPFDTKQEREFYGKVKMEVRQEYLRIMEEDGKNKMMELFELLLRLRQATVHPNIVIGGLAKKFSIDNPKLWEGHSTKESKLIDMFRQHVEGDKTIIVCHYTDEMDMIHNALQKNYPLLKLEKFNGLMNLTARDNCVAKCMNGEVDVLIIQILCGGVGLNLQVFNKVYILTPDWNPGNEIQAIARCHRIGQTRDVDVYKIIIAEDEIPTIDQLLLNVQTKKRALMAECLDDRSLEFNERFQYSSTKITSGLSFQDFRQLLH
jgi:SNF2 family DNA or RNA helicase